mmetsp:Transcript_65776/g.148425  ORF Transcript_65776/g.148425 Transcript_65776/m.148425 type:complete len:103 (-) Transcript_65776:100-408(-)
MAARPTLIPLALLALAVLGAFCGLSAFVGGARSASTSTSLRVSTAQRALPLEGASIADSSVLTALAVSTPGFWANIVTVMVPVTFLVVLYLQSERTKAEEGL